MSEVKQEEPVKQEGDFKIKSKTPRKFANENPNEVTKVNIKEPLIETPEDIVKVVIPKQDGIIQNEEPEAVPVLETPEEEFTPIKEVTEEEVKKVTVEAQEAIRDNKILGKALPENIEKLVSFMEEVPGATIEDYVRLNADYTNVADNVLLREYYLKTKPYLENDDVDLLLEDYAYDLDLDEDIDIRKKKLALKEEVAKAKGFLEETKSKYYDEIKL